MVGEARAIQPGRVLNECQTSAVTVDVEQVLTGSGVTEGESIVVELPGDCESVLAFDAAVPTARAIYILQNKGFEMRRTQPATSIDRTRREMAYWRVPAGLPMPYDSGGRVALFGPSGSFLDEDAGHRFSFLVSGIGELDYMAPEPPAERVEGVPLFWIFVWPAVLATFLGGVGVTVIGLWVTRRRRWPLRVMGFALALVAAFGVVLWGATPLARLLRDIDFAGQRAEMQATVDEIRALGLPADDFGQYGYADYVIGESGRLMVFFFRAAAFSPDPYCGYEYASYPDLLEVDPLGSGDGVAEDLGEGWYWVCAS